MSFPACEGGFSDAGGELRRFALLAGALLALLAGGASSLRPPALK